MHIRIVLLAATALSMAPAAFAQEDRLSALEKRLAAQDERIAQLEALVATQATMLDQKAPPAPVPTLPAPATAPVAAASATPASTASTASGDFRIPGLDVSGDMRVRQEWNFVDGRDRSRTAVRARVRATYAVSDHFAVGTQIATGDPDDPNSTDVTLGNFVDDFAVSLDQAWIRYTNGGLTAYAGKFPQVFQRTDMLWDGDVSPQGVALAYGADLGGPRVDARGLYFVIDEAAVARDSDMLGGQLALSAPLGSDFKAGLTGSYYHYRLGSVAGADAGDFRGNLIAGGRYLSDYHLIEGIGTLNWKGASERWPVSFTADYVRNLGAAVSGDTAFNLELAAGRTAKPGDWKVAYNYSEVEVDSVLAAFSHDNIDLSTNYKLHGVGINYVPAPHLQLDLLWYHYRQLDQAFPGIGQSNDWLDRIRLAFMVSF
ncbi:MAG: putative porin [Sphingopyxis sp.]|uniref:putative porin n=1 Tax=Sphingopyxis sp. TaxID=1908224 RepID=UPI001A2B4227|nr:putative porin [Sphingopyxis sp.]MBJ7498333.1 putative porin [Sphingopyxis sp.]